jgi:hypothetical protein
VREPLHVGRQASSLDVRPQLAAGVGCGPGEDPLEHPERTQDQVVVEPEPAAAAVQGGLDARAGGVLHPAQVLGCDVVPGGAQHVGAHPAACRLLGQQARIGGAGRHPHREGPRGQRRILGLYGREEPHHIAPARQPSRRQALGSQAPSTHLGQGCRTHSGHRRTDP